MRLSLFLVAALVIFALAGPALRGSPSQKVVDHDFIGGERCRACHAAEFASVEKGPHARAYEVLGDKDRRDPRCLSCHTMVPDDLGAGLLGVQCESCHGPGRHYSVDWVMRDRELAGALQLQKVDEKTCARCHTDSTPSLLPFVYLEKLQLIKHWPDPPAAAPSALQPTAPQSGAAKPTPAKPR